MRATELLTARRGRVRHGHAGGERCGTSAHDGGDGTCAGGKAAAYGGVVAERFFPYRCDPRFAAIWGMAGVRPGTHGVTVDESTLRATYGLLSLQTPIGNVAGGHITEGYRWWTAIGARLSFVDDGLTFGTNTRRGVCVHFHDPVRRVIGPRNHSALTVTVDDCEGLIEAIGADSPR